MTEKDWQTFVNDGVASKELIVKLAYKIYSSIELDQREMSVYIHMSDDVEDVLRKIKILENATTRNR